MQICVRLGDYAVALLSISNDKLPGTLVLNCAISDLACFAWLQSLSNPSPGPRRSAVDNTYSRSICQTNSSEPPLPLTPPPQMSAGVFTVSLLGKQGRSTLGDSSRSEQIITHRLFVFLIQMHQIMLSMHGPLPKRELLRTYTVLNMIYSPAVINHKYIYISS